VKRKVFKLHNDAGDIPCSITLWSAGGVSFQSAGPTTAKAWFSYVKMSIIKKYKMLLLNNLK